MNKKLIIFGAGIVAVSLIIPTAAMATNDKDHKVTICHATSSVTNPWVSITVARSALKAHEGHGDLIPAPPGGCPVLVVVPPTDPPVDPPVEEPTDPPTEEPADPDEPAEPETPIEEPTEPETPAVTPETPVAEVPAAFVPQQLPTLPVAELAYTGSNDVNPFPYLALGALLVGAGVFMTTRKKARA